jgi:hypothetical protein
MKPILLVSALLLSSCGTVRAGEVRAGENGVRVPYSRAVPSTIRTYAPRKAATRFFGTLRVEPLHGEVFLHLYQAKQAPKARKKGSVAQPPYWLDIFTKEKKRFTRLQHIRVPSNEGNWAFGAQLMWLEPKLQKVPVLMLEAMNSGNFYGPTASFQLLVFPQGLNGEVKTQIFAPYADHNETTYFIFDQLDESGLMVVKKVYQESGDKPIVDTILRWNGKQFAAEQAQPQ